METNEVAQSWDPERRGVGGRWRERGFVASPKRMHVYNLLLYEINYPIGILKGGKNMKTDSKLVLDRVKDIFNIVKEEFHNWLNGLHKVRAMSFIYT